MSKTDVAFVNTTIRDGAAIITFGTPASNSLPGGILARIAESIEEAGVRDDIFAIILQSFGNRTFCAGASFDELAAISDERSGYRFFMGFANVILAIRRSPKPVIGRIQGKAVGGGVGLAAACDICVATRFASVRLSELAVGIGPFVIGPVVQRKIGLSAFSYMALTPNEWQSAQWAYELGLYQKLFNDDEEMDLWIDTHLAELKGSNPEAVSALKKVFWEGTEHWEQLLRDRAAVSGRLVLSDFTRDAIEAFKGN